jgi:dTDP-4-amino-4,6-dideoxygalactose transaminase
VDIDWSYLPGEVIAAFLWAQMEDADQIICKRLAIWAFYHQALPPQEKAKKLRRPIVPTGCGQNAHFESASTRGARKSIEEFGLLGNGRS